MNDSLIKLIKKTGITKDSGKFFEIASNDGSFLKISKRKIQMFHYGS